MIIYALETGSTFAGPLSYSVSVERAQQDAAERLAEYRRMAEENPEDWADNLPMATELTWELKEYRFGSHPKMVEAKPRWTASVNDHSTFTIREVEVLDATE